MAEYKYDALWRRTDRTVTTNGIATVTRYLYDGLDILTEYNENNTIRTKYTHDYGIDVPLAIERSGQSYYYHKDALGSITTITDGQANIVQWYRYDSFGRITDRMTPAFVQPYIFTGREIDEETGLYYYRFRYYDPEIGRFISEDPIGFRSQDYNLFRYVRNSPWRWSDPFGLFRFGKRPLSDGKAPWFPSASANPIDNYFNTELSHEHGFFDDGSGDNIGFGPLGRFSEDPAGKGYRFDNQYYEDELMREALKYVKDGEYSNLPWKKNNCQDWAERLREEYERLKRKRDGRNIECK